MLSYNIRSKMNAFLVSTVMSLPCTYVLCMEEPEGDNPEVTWSVHYVDKQIGNKRSIWEQERAPEMRQRATDLRNHLEKLGHIKEGGSIEDGVSNIRNMARRGEDVSFETKSMINAYHAAKNKFELMEKVQQTFTSSVQMIVPQSSGEVYGKLVGIIARRPKLPLTLNEANEVRDIAAIDMGYGEQGDQRGTL
jgi:hypothetical protein